MLPLGDASRRLTSAPVVTILLVAINVIVFLVELAAGDKFVIQWSVRPADIWAGHDLITIVTAMFLHASWSHIIGNMVFLYAFGPEIEDAMAPVRYTVFYLVGGAIRCSRRSRSTRTRPCRTSAQAALSRRSWARSS